MYPFHSKEPVAVMGQPAEERAHGRITMKTYYQYFTTGGGHLFTLLVLVVFILAEVRSSCLHCIDQYHGLLSTSIRSFWFVWTGGSQTGNNSNSDVMCEMFVGQHFMDQDATKISFSF